MSETSGDVYGRDPSFGAGGGATSHGGTSQGGAAGGAGDAGGAWEQARSTVSDLGERVAEQAGALGRRVREARLERRLGDAIEARPWTALMIALGIGAALAAASGGRSRSASGERSPDEGDDYLAEYEDALVAGSGRWASRGRSAVADVGSVRTAASGATAGGVDEWRPSDEQLAGELDPLGEMGRGFPANPGAMEGRVTRDSWGRGMIE